MKTLDKKLNKKNTICTLGSCFAVEIRTALTERGFDMRPALEPDKGASDQLIWYNTFSILYEFEYH